MATARPSPAIRNGPRTTTGTCSATAAAEIVNGLSQLTIVPLAADGEGASAHRLSPRLRSAGPVGDLMARQAEAYGVDRRVGLAEAHPSCRQISSTSITTHSPPRSVGWDGVTIEGNVVTGVDGDAFSDRWLEAIEHLHSTA